MQETSKERAIKYLEENDKEFIEQKKEADKWSTTSMLLFLASIFLCAVIISYTNKFEKVDLNNLTPVEFACYLFIVILFFINLWFFGLFFQARTVINNKISAIEEIYEKQEAELKALELKEEEERKALERKMFYDLLHAQEAKVQDLINKIERAKNMTNPFTPDMDKYEELGLYEAVTFNAEVVQCYKDFEEQKKLSLKRLKLEKNSSQRELNRLREKELYTL